MSLKKHDIFKSDRFKYPCFDQKAGEIFKTITTVPEVDSLIWNFDEFDLMSQCGGPHMKGKGAGGAFAVMPCAFIETKENLEFLVGKEAPDGNIWILNQDGSKDTDTGLKEDAFLVEYDKKKP